VLGHDLPAGEKAFHAMGRLDSAGNKSH
jgi:hypothetical protein